MANIPLGTSTREIKNKSTTPIDMTKPLCIMSVDGKESCKIKYNSKLDDEDVYMHLIEAPFTPRLIQIDNCGNPLLWEPLTDTWRVENYIEQESTEKPTT